MSMKNRFQLQLEDIKLRGDIASDKIETVKSVLKNNQCLLQLTLMKCIP